MSGINIAYLCSGSQFVNAPSSSVSEQKMDTSLQKDKRPLKSNHQRLESFYSKTIKVHQPVFRRSTTEETMKNSKFDDGQASAVVGINIDVLRSGRQFVAPEASMFEKRAPVGTHQRLEMFHDKTLRAHHNPVHENTSNTGINIDLLRSGHQFVDSPESKHQVIAGLPSLHSRRRDFYNRTLSAHKIGSLSNADTPQDKNHPQAPILQSRLADTKANEAKEETADTTGNLISINLDFIRSGLEFSMDNASSPEARRWDRFHSTSKHSRLEKFHNDMLKAFSRSPAKKNSSASKPNVNLHGINLDFMRSGNEFKGPTASSPEAKRWDRFRSHNRSKYSRLESFHSKTLSAYAQSIRTN